MKTPTTPCPKAQFNQIERDLVCIGCETGVAAIIDLFLLGASAEAIEELSLGLCVLLGQGDKIK